MRYLGYDKYLAKKSGHWSDPISIFTHLANIYFLSARFAICVTNTNIH